MTGFVTSGQGSDQVLTPGTHEAVDHTAGPLNLLDETAHDVLDHTGLTGVPAPEAFTSGVHNSTDHSAIPGAGVPILQQIIQPKGLKSAVWTPNSNSPISTSWIEEGAPGTYDRFGFPVLADSASPTYASLVDVSGGREYIEVNCSVAEIASAYAGPETSNNIGYAKGKFVLWLGTNANVGTGLTRVGIGDFSGVGLNTGSDYVVISVGVGVGSTWFVERRVGGVLKTPINTSIGPAAAPTPQYLVIDYTTPTSLTVSIYSSTPAQLFSQTFSGASEVPVAPTGGGVVFKPFLVHTGAAIMNFYGGAISWGGT